MTQRQIVYEYIKENGSFTPARERTAAHNGKILGSEAGRRARELRKQGLVESEKLPGTRFIRYFVKEDNMGAGYDAAKKMADSLRVKPKEKTPIDEYREALRWYEDHYARMTPEAIREADKKLALLREASEVYETLAL